MRSTAKDGTAVLCGGSMEIGEEERMVQTGNLLSSLGSNVVINEDINELQEGRLKRQREF